MRTWKRNVYGSYNGRTFRAVLACARDDDARGTGPDTYDPVGNWVELPPTGTGGLGHYTDQGHRYHWARQTRDGLVLELSAGTGYYPCQSGGYSWGWDASLHVCAVEDASEEARVALGLVEDAAQA